MSQLIEIIHSNTLSNVFIAAISSFGATYLINKGVDIYRRRSADYIAAENALMQMEIDALRADNETLSKSGSQIIIDMKAA